MLNIVYLSRIVKGEKTNAQPRRLGIGKRLRFEGADSLRDAEEYPVGLELRRQAFAVVRIGVLVWCRGTTPALRGSVRFKL